MQIACPAFPMRAVRDFRELERCLLSACCLRRAWLRR